MISFNKMFSFNFKANSTVNACSTMRLKRHITTYFGPFFKNLFTFGFTEVMEIVCQNYTQEVRVF